MMGAFRYCPSCAAPLEQYTDGEGRLRLRCPASGCGFVHYDNPTPVVAAIVQLGEEVVLVRNVGWPEKWFGLVTGFLEKGETPEAGVLREVHEELGVQGVLGELVGLYPFEMMNQLIIAYHVLIEDEPSAGAELAEIKRVAIARVRPWPMATGDALRDWLERRTGTGGFDG